MKLTLTLKLVALIIIGTASSLLAATPPPTPQDFEFEWQGSDGAFSPTFLYITAALGIPTAPGAAITDFQITTPVGVWTQDGFTKLNGQVLSPVTWLADSTLTVSGSTAAPVLTFSNGGDTLTTPGNFPFMVNLATDSITDSQTFAPADVTGANTGSWTPVLDDADTPAPDATNSLLLFAVAIAGLGATRRLRHAAV
jgi:hypothetical protein